MAVEDEQDVADELDDEFDELFDEPIEPEVDETTAVSRPSGRRRSNLKIDELVSYFAPCGRCGYFLAGYRAAQGMADLETAVAQAKSGWIVLQWNTAVRELVLKSYGSRIEENDFHYEGCCSECRRHFIFRASRSPKHPDTFRIELKPRKRQ